eukprot:14786155-Alexandrium_andersonii.AAC.1
MSASLVGSEMCIRDRRRSARRRREAPPAAGERRQGAVRCKRLALRGLVCLLYTSDAADDM